MTAEHSSQDREIKNLSAERQDILRFMRALGLGRVESRFSSISERQQQALLIPFTSSLQSYFEQRKFIVPGDILNITGPLFVEQQTPTGDRLFERFGRAAVIAGHLDSVAIAAAPTEEELVKANHPASHYRTGRPLDLTPMVVFNLKDPALRIVENKEVHEEKLDGQLFTVPIQYRGTSLSRIRTIDT